MIRIENLHKSYPMGNRSLHVLKGINFTVEEGELVAIMGSSGSGKSTLLNILGNIKQKKNSASKIKLEEKLLEFALVCCQVAFPKIYELISERPSILEWDDEFAFSVTEKKEEQDPMFKQSFIRRFNSCKIRAFNQFAKPQIIWF